MNIRADHDEAYPISTLDRTVMRGWPPKLVEIAELIGPPSALALAIAYRGQEVYVPKNLRTASARAMAELIGAEATARLINYYTGTTISMPMMAYTKSRKILILDAEGRTTEVARRFGVTTRWVRALRAEANAASDDRQLDFFMSII